MSLRRGITISMVIGAISFAFGLCGRGATITVSNNCDCSLCTGLSLRTAIGIANALSEPATINFLIGTNSSVVQTIDLCSNLPPIANTNGVTIDATTQPGYVGMPLIQLNCAGYDGFSLLSNSNVVRGFAIFSNTTFGVSIGGNFNRIEGNFIGTDASGSKVFDINSDAYGIDVDGNGNFIGSTVSGMGNLVVGNGIGIFIFGSNNVVQGNRIGTDVTGTFALGNSTGLSVQGPHSLIGGIGQGAGNLISGNTDDGVDIFSMNNILEGNRIGTDITGTFAVSNFLGLEIAETGNQIGGNAPGAGNLISGNGGGGGIFILSDSNSLQSNLIGTDSTGSMPLGNQGDGISLGEDFDGTIFANGNLIGSEAGASNIIAFNVGSGICVPVGTNNMFLGNLIFSNSSLGIDLGCDGVTANDPGDTNGIQNFPVLTSAISAAGQTVVEGFLNSRPFSTNRIELFANPGCNCAGTNCNGQGQTFLGATNVFNDGSGQGTFRFTSQIALLPSEVITATATSPELGTSEFSACLPQSLPDLIGSWGGPSNRLVKSCGFTAQLEPYTILQRFFFVTNQGLAKAPSTLVMFFLSDDGVTTNRFLSRAVCGPLPISGSRRIIFRAKLPVGMTATNRFLLAVVNANYRVIESDTNNNTTVSQRIQ